MKICKLEEVCNIETGNSAPQGDSFFENGECPFIRVKHISDTNNGFVKNTDLVNKKAIAEKKLKLIPKDSIVFAKSGMSIHLNKKARLPQDSYVVSHLAIISPKTKKLDSDYLYYWATQFKFSNLASGTTLPSIKTSDIKKVEIPVPSLETQKKIVEILEKAEKLKEKREEANQDTESIIQSIFYDMFGDPIKNEKSWELKNIGNITDLVRGSSPRPKGDPRYYGGNIPRLMIKDITRDGRLVTPSIDFLTENGAKLSRPLTKGTVVMTVSGDVGVVSTLAVDSCIHDGFVGFKNLNINIILPTYLEYFFRTIKYTHAKRKLGAIFQNITTKQIKEIEIPLPPIEVQHKFEKIVNNLESIKKKQKDSTVEINTLFDALMQKAFRGELI